MNVKSSAETSMFCQYRDVPRLPAPEFMSDLKKMKFAKIADIQGNEFECVFGNLFFAKSRHCFHILFYTYYGEKFMKFLCLDKTCGDIYWIKYNEDHTEGSTYVIESSEKISYQKFAENIEKSEQYFPGLTDTFKNLSAYNWEDYLDITYMQPRTESAFLIKKENDDTIDFLYFNIGEGAIFYSCAKNDYDNWKLTRKNVADDFLYSTELLEMSIDGTGKKCGFLINRELSKLIGTTLDTILRAKFDVGNMTVMRVEKGMYTRIEQNVYSKEIDDCFFGIKAFFEK